MCSQALKPEGEWNEIRLTTGEKNHRSEVSESLKVVECPLTSTCFSPANDRNTTPIDTKMMVGVALNSLGGPIC